MSADQRHLPLRAAALPLTTLLFIVTGLALRAGPSASQAHKVWLAGLCLTRMVSLGVLAARCKIYPAPRVPAFSRMAGSAGLICRTSLRSVRSGAVGWLSQPGRAHVADQSQPDPGLCSGALSRGWQALSRLGSPAPGILLNISVAVIMGVVKT